MICGWVSFSSSRSRSSCKSLSLLHRHQALSVEVIEGQHLPSRQAVVPGHRDAQPVFPQLAETAQAQHLGGIEGPHHKVHGFAQGGDHGQDLLVVIVIRDDFEAVFPREPG